MAQIKRFGVGQTAKFFAVMYFICSAIFMIPVALVSLIVGGGANSPAAAFGGGFFVLFMPVLYAAMGFIFVAIGCLVYNVVANWIGGIEVEIE